MISSGKTLDSQRISQRTTSGPSEHCTGQCSFTSEQVKILNIMLSFTITHTQIRTLVWTFLF